MQESSSDCASTRQQPEELMRMPCMQRCAANAGGVGDLAQMLKCEGLPGTESPICGSLGDSESLQDGVCASGAQLEQQRRHVCWVGTNTHHQASADGRMKLWGQPLQKGV